MHQPLISIIITVLNGEKVISECLSSIHSQTFTNYEVIIVDGGSTDQTVEIVEKSPLLNIKLNVIPGLGLYAGLNAGIKLSVGKWLYFIGCDDQLCNNDTLLDVATFLSAGSTETKVFVGNVDCIKQENLLRAKLGSPYFMHYQVHHQGMFYDKNIFETYLYNENRKIISDYELNLKLKLDGIPHQYMNIIVCNFGGDGVSENQANKGFNEMQEVHKELFKGMTRQWVVGYCSFKRSLFLLRKKLNLLNVKKRFNRVIKVLPDDTTR